MDNHTLTDSAVDLQTTDAPVANAVTTARAEKVSIYERITGRILGQLEAGHIPWRKTWSIGLPKSMNTGKEYRGINILLLSFNDYKSRYWVTYREALRLGGHVRKGERVTPIIYWKWRTEEDMKKLRAKTGRESFAPCIPFVSAVFNLDQVEGVATPDDDTGHASSNPLATAAMVFEVMPDKPTIDHCKTHNPAYSRVTDQVTIPHLSQFETAEEYYCTLFHELVHSTGHSRRLNRFTETEGDVREKYSQEELVAEFGAAFLCGFAGIENAETSSLQAGYIQSWIKVLKNDNRLALKAASAAQRAADYIRGKVPADNETHLSD